MFVGLLVLQCGVGHCKTIVVIDKDGSGNCRIGSQDQPAPSLGELPSTDNWTGSNPVCQSERIHIHDQAGCGMHR